MENMARSIGELQELFWNVHGIHLTVHHHNGRQVRSDCTIEPYSVGRAAPGRWTAMELIHKHLHKRYPDFKFRIRWPDGGKCKRNAKLSTLRRAACKV